MKVEVNQGTQTITVTLSERNLLALLAKVRDPESARTIYRDDPSEPMALIVRAETDDEHGRVVEVKGESNLTHYMDRPAGPPGKMVPKAEDYIQRHTRKT